MVVPLHRQKKNDLGRGGGLSVHRKVCHAAIDLKQYSFSPQHDVAGIGFHRLCRLLREHQWIQLQKYKYSENKREDGRKVAGREYTSNPSPFCMA